MALRHVLEVPVGQFIPDALKFQPDLLTRLQNARYHTFPFGNALNMGLLPFQ